MKSQNILKYLLGTLVFISSFAVHAGEDLFAPESIMPLKLEASFAQIIKQAKKIGAAGESKFPQYPAALSYRNASGAWVRLNAKVVARGNTSVTECDFVKLELELEENAALAASPFAENKKIKIGTHCGDSKQHTESGRLKSDVATHTEAFLYRLADALGTVAPRARYADMTYQDTKTKKSIQRKAFILESHGRVAKRLKADKIENAAGDINLDFDHTLVTKSHIASVYFFENLIGNSDYEFPVLTLDGNYMRGLGQEGTSAYWNLKVFQNKKDKNHFTVVPYDFDLAAPVPMMPFNFDQDLLKLYGHFVKLSSQSAISSWTSLQKLRAYFKMDTLLANQKDLLQKRAKVYAQLEKAPLSPESKKVLKVHFDGFYEALNHLVDVPLLTHVSSWRNDELETEESQCLVRVIPPMPGRIVSQGQSGLLEVEVIDVHNAMTDLSTWQPCKIPGFVDNSAQFLSEAPEVKP